MKKFFSTLAIAAALTATACSQAEDVQSVRGGKEVTVTIGTALPQIASRTYSDGLSATRLQYAVYDDNSTTPLFVRETSFPEGSRETEVKIKLVTGKTYDIVFWASSPKQTVYTLNADGQTVTVDYTAMEANEELNDAFFFFRHDLKITGTVNETITLKRPFAQVNLGTNDYADALTAGLTVYETSMKATVANTLHLDDGGVSGAAEVEFKRNAIPDVTTEDFPVQGYDYLEMNYLLVGKDKSLIDMSFTIYENGSTVSQDGTINTFTVPNVPVQRNHRTNIFGSLLTDPADFKVKIDQLYEDPDYDHPL